MCKHMKMGRADMCACGASLPIVSHTSDHYLTDDPRDVTCGRCKRTNYYIRYMQRIMDHIAEGPCDNKACRVCNH